MIRKTAIVISDFSGGEDTRTPILSMPLNKSPNMRNFHCAGVGNRLMKRGGFDKVNSSTVESDGLDVCYPPGYQTTDYALRDAAARTQISQGFKCKTSSTVTKVKLWLKKVGTPAGTDTITLEIQSDASGVPSGTEVTNGVATAIDISDTATLVTTEYSWVTFTFSTNPTLVAGTQYHLVLTGAFDIDGTNYVYWGVDNYDVIYPDGSMSVYDATTWTVETSYNACFEVYITNGAKGNDGVALWDFSSKNMLLGVFGTSIYKMDKSSSGNPDGVWDALSGGSGWDTYTKIVSSFNGSDAATAFTDPIAGAWTFVSGAELDTAQKKWTASLLLNGTTDYVTQPDNNNYNLGAGDWTMRGWFRFANVSKDQAICGQFVDTSNAWRIQVTNTGAFLNFYAVSAGTVIANFGTAWTPLADTWYFIEVSRGGNTPYMFIDGVTKTVTQTVTISGKTIPDIAAVFTLGKSFGTFFLDGWVDDFRLDKGICRNTASYTSPAAAFSAASAPLTSSRFWTMADWQSGRALINTDIGLYTYLGTGSISLVSGAPVGKFVVIWKNYVFMAGIRGSSNTVRYSDLSDYTTWTATNTLNFDTSDGDVITGIRILKGKLYIFKRYSIFRVTYLGSSPTFQVDQISGIGSPCHYTIKEVDIGGELGNVLIYLTTDKKLAIFDGYNVQIISDVLTEETNDLFASADDQPLSFNDMNFRYTDLFHASVKNDTQEYILYSVLGTDTSVNYAFVFDYKTGGIFPYDGQVFASSCYALSTSKVKKLYCSGYTGYTWLQESGNSDDGSDINAYWVSGKIKSSGVALLNKNLLLGINAKYAVSASIISVTLQYRFNWGVSWITPTSSTFDSAHNDELNFGKTAVFDIGSINNMLQIKIKDSSSNPAPTIYGFELYREEKPLGVSTEDKATT